MKKPLIKEIALTATSAILLVLSFPDYDLYFLAWFALVPLFFVLKDKGLKSSFAFSFFFGVIFIASVT